MGKRKLHTSSHFTCDWTGFPMRNSNCYMPLFTEGTKQKKMGMYCNWESVIAHAHHLCEVEKQFGKEQLQFVGRRVADIIGTSSVNCAPHWQALEHFGGSMDAKEFHANCVYETSELTTVCLGKDGSVFEKVIDSSGGTYDVGMVGDCVQPFRKSKALSKTNLNIYHNPLDQTPNTYASSLFKMKLFGDVTLACTSKEASAFPRTRFIPYTLAEFEAEFVKKKRKRDDDGAENYGEVKKKMQEELGKFEETMTAGAKTPHEIGRVMNMPAASGKKMATYARSVGEE